MTPSHIRQCRAPEPNLHQDPELLLVRPPQAALHPVQNLAPHPHPSASDVPNDVLTHVS